MNKILSLSAIALLAFSATPASAGSAYHNEPTIYDSMEWFNPIYWRDGNFTNYIGEKCHRYGYEVCCESKALQFHTYQLRDGDSCPQGSNQISVTRHNEVITACEQTSNKYCFTELAVPLTTFELFITPPRFVIN